MLETILSICCVACFALGFFGAKFEKFSPNWIAGGLMFGAAVLLLI